MSLPECSPGEQGVDARGIIDFLDAARDHGIDLHGLAIARHGHAVARGWRQPYAANRVHLLYSVSKSLTATAIAFLAQEGVLRLDDPVLAHLPIDGASVDERWRDVQILHCLSMTVGHQEDAWDFAVLDLTPGADRDVLEQVLERPPSQPPGTTFAYNQVATYLLSRVVTHRTERRVVEILTPRLFDPLDMGEVLWHTDPAGFDLGFTGAHLTTDALLSFGQFVLDRGRWQGRRLLDEAWFDTATRPLAPLGRSSGASSEWGYGYSFWIAEHGVIAAGGFGQFAIMLPGQDAVIAITSEQLPGQDSLGLVWEHLLPAFGAGEGGHATARPDPHADEELASRLAPLDHPGPADTWPGPESVRFVRSGTSQLPGSYAAVTLARTASGWVLGLERDGTTFPVRVGAMEWADSVIEVSGIRDRCRLPMSARGGWVDDDTFRAELAIVQTPHTILVEARLSTGAATLTWRAVPLMGTDPLALAVR